MLKIIMRRKTALLSFIFLAIIVFVGIFADVIAPYPVNQQHVRDRYSAPMKQFDAGINEDGSSSITYHFRIPFLCLVGGERVYKVGLYPNTISDLRTDICAYYLLAKDEQNKQDFEIPTEGGNFTVIID